MQPSRTVLCSYPAQGYAVILHSTVQRGCIPTLVYPRGFSSSLPDEPPPPSGALPILMVLAALCGTGTGELRRHFQFVRAVGKACGDDERQSGRVVHDIEVFRYFCFRTGRIGQSDAY